MSTFNTGKDRQGSDYFGNVRYFARGCQHLKSESDFGV